MRGIRVLAALILAGAILAGLPAFVFAQEEDAEAASTPPPAAPAPPTDVQMDKPKISNLPQNWKGMTGLFLTTATRTLPAGTVELGPAYRNLISHKPKFERTTYAFNAAVGIPGHFEFGLHVPYVETNLFMSERIDEFGRRVRDFSQKSQSDFGSVEGMMKWAFAQQQLFLPSLAAGFGFIAPTGDYTQRISQVKSYGLRGMLAMGIEINDLFFTDYAFAVMADGGIVIQDAGVGANREYEEKHGEVHFGMVFPLHPSNYVTFITEYEGILMGGTTNEEDENTFAAALRFTTQHIAVTAGAHYSLVEVRDMEDRWGYFASLSYKLGPPWPMFP